MKVITNTYNLTHSNTTHKNTYHVNMSVFNLAVKMYSDPK